MAELRKPGLATRLAYGIGGAAGGIKNNGFEYVLLLFYSQVLGLSAVLVAAALWIALLIDAVSDPVVGYWSDNLRTKWGRRHPFMYVGMVPVAIAYFFVWNPPSELSGAQLFAWLLGFTVIVRLMYTLFEVPSTALAAELTQDYDARTSLMSFRYFFGWVGGLSVQIILFFFLLQPSEGDPSGFFHIAGWHTYGLLGASCIFTAVLITSVGTHRHIPHLKAPPAPRKLTPLKVLGEIWETVSNPSFRALFIATLFGLVASGISATLNQYINGFFWEFTSDQIGGLTFAVYLSAIMALALAPMAGRVLGKKKAAIIIGLLAFTIAPAPVIARQFGLLPPNGTEALYFIVLGVTIFDIALIIAYQMLAASMVADIVEQNELVTGRRSEGIYFAGISFMRKLAQGVGILSASFILAVASITPGMRSSQASDEAVRTLGWGYALTLLALWMIMIVCVNFYRISREDHESNLRALAERENGS
ncbi:MFS transporter [Henriciella sp.]|uniref:MFS transporter n=1 Tax=Henriciella sp. TaxID=1968823 RepID=UPI00263631FC|nr:MFS transporter [Henriciella sp.]